MRFMQQKPDVDCPCITPDQFVFAYQTQEFIIDKNYDNSGDDAYYNTLLQ